MKKVLDYSKGCFLRLLILSRVTAASAYSAENCLYSFGRYSNLWRYQYRQARGRRRLIWSRICHFGPARNYEETQSFFLKSLSFCSSHRWPFWEIWYRLQFFKKVSSVRLSSVAFFSMGTHLVQKPQRHLRSYSGWSHRKIIQPMIAQSLVSCPY